MSNTLDDMKDYSLEMKEPYRGEAGETDHGSIQIRLVLIYKVSTMAVPRSS
jgi:hypothetical protein